MSELRRWLDFIVGAPILFALSCLRHKNTSKPTKINRVLVIKLAAMGDTIILIPVLRELRRAYPDIKIDWLVSPVNETIAATVPYIDQIITWRVSSALSAFSVLRTIRKNKYDAVIDFEQWSRATAIMTFFSGSAVRLGFQTKGQAKSGAYTHILQKKFHQHEIEDFYDLCRILGPLEHSLHLELWDTQKGDKELNLLAPTICDQDKKPLIVILHPGCGADGLPREWPLKSYMALGSWILSSFPAHLLLTGGPEETSKTFILQQYFKDSCINLAGKLSWLGIISLVKKSDLVISGNTGIMHIAAAFRKYQVALHGPTNPLLWGPLNQNAVVIHSSCPRCPCLKLGFEYHTHGQECMAQIGVEVVQEAINNLMASREHYL